MVSGETGRGFEASRLGDGSVKPRQTTMNIVVGDSDVSVGRKRLGRGGRLVGFGVRDGAELYTEGWMYE